MFADILNGIDAIFAPLPVGLAQLFAIIIGLVDNDGPWGDYEGRKAGPAPKCSKASHLELPARTFAMIAILELFHQ
jgi:hypothetical protein